MGYVLNCNRSVYPVIVGSGQGTGQSVSRGGHGCPQADDEGNGFRLVMKDYEL